jgi:hypothetical protein
MDEVAIKYYRRLLREGFQYSGSLENPSIYLDSVGEQIRLCGHAGYNYVHVYINVADGKISQVKYLCNCDPITNVVVEVFCSLIDRQSLAEVEAMTPDRFTQAIGSTGEDFLKKATAMLELFKRGLTRYLHPAA